MPSFFFSKIHILLYHPHLPQVFTILPLQSIHQPPCTTNLKLLMHLKNDLQSFFFNSYELKTTSLYFLSIFIEKNSKILILKFLWFIEKLKLTILGGSLLFEIQDAWRRILCAKQFISLVETIKLDFFSRSVRPYDFWVSRLAVDDLHGNLLVNVHKFDFSWATYKLVVERLKYKSSQVSFAIEILNKKYFFLDDLHGSRPSDDIHVSRSGFYSEILVKPCLSWTTYRLVF
ncbi:hypothetical protein IGI04_007839 [Brassica rapa subsp. trilocularis]|uniref:Uncharacterized protein n=1 Tax=Brassica rapa subsp. trilocularis TaxID=1813537 RepID=A0ABQ7NN73_BRACM|nr:hypothetical protein IGI04_007839 [Brassica rapa subsp. trilocularis]